MIDFIQDYIQRLIRQKQSSRLNNVAVSYCNCTLSTMQFHPVNAITPGPRRFSAVEKVTVSRPRSGGLAGSRAICFAAAISTTSRETNDRALGCGTTGYEKRVGTGVSGGSKKKKRGREKRKENGFPVPVYEHGRRNFE